MHFLKSDELDYLQYPGPPDEFAYVRVALWLQQHGYTLLLDDDSWKDGRSTIADAVIYNYRMGYHEYEEVIELLTKSNEEGLLLPVV